MTKCEYKEYFEQNNFKGNNYETAKFINFLMGKKTKGKEIEKLTGIKHSQITSYKKIIKSGKMEELRNKSISKVFKSIESSPKEDEEIIYGIEKLSLDDIIGDFSDKAESEDDEAESEDDDKAESEDENLSWEESLKRLVNEHSNDYTDELELWIGDLESQVRELKDEIKRLKRKKRSVGSETLSPGEDEKKIKKLCSENERLRNENTSLLAYKKFFEDMKLKMSEFS